MKKKIWILNHYATNMFFEGAGRHHSFAKYLTRMGYEVTIFCANVVHNREDVININDNSLFCDKEGQDGVNYTFIKTRPYTGNGLERIKNMFDYLINVKKVAKKKIQEGIGPDIIIASSVHPLALVAGIQIGRKSNVPCICEIRDIWPLSLVEFGIIKEESLINIFLQKLELWTYRKADKIIFTMEGGQRYIADMGWSKLIPNEKVLYLNNGVDLDLYNANKLNSFDDEDLDNNKKKFIYAGSIGLTDKLDRLVEVAKKCQQEGLCDVQFLVYGSGSEKERLENLCISLELKNIVFKGRVSKDQIPYVLSKSYANVFFLENYRIYKYGISLNKLFEYLAAGKPIIVNRKFGYNNIQNVCGFTDDNMFESIKALCKMDEKSYNKMCANAIELSKQYSFEFLSNKLESFFNYLWRL